MRIWSKSRRCRLRSLRYAHKHVSSPPKSAHIARINLHYPPFTLCADTLFTINVSIAKEYANVPNVSLVSFIHFNLTLFKF